METTYHIMGEEEMRRVAGQTARRLKPGDIVCLYGQLGAGKTTFCQGAIAALGVKETVTSPTFTIVHQYRGDRFPVYHFDVYRVHSGEELFEIGYEDYFFGDGVCFVEWAELIEELIPENAIRVYLTYSEEEEDGRWMRIEYPGN